MSRGMRARRLDDPEGCGIGSFVLDDVRKAIAELRARPLLLAAALLWALEIFWVQERTLRAGYSSEFGALRLLAERCVRLGFDLSFALGLLSLLPRAAIALPLLAWQVLAALLLGYHGYFDRALSWQTIAAQAREGLAVAGMGTGLLGGPLVAALCLAFVAKLALALRARRGGPPPWRLGLVGLLGWAGMAGALNLVYPLQKLQVYSSIERTGVAYGYFWTWLGEAIYLDGHLLERAIEAARTRTSDRLRDEPLPPVADRIVFVQVESLDDALLGHEEKGERVLPFLTALRDRSAYYRVRPIHDNGSADADFSMLTGLAPSPDVITYRLLHYPYGDTLPKILGRAGYHTEAIHGLYGHFFGRQPVFEGPMGFDSVLFEKELEEEHGARPGRWGIEDAALFDVAASRLLGRKGKVFQFLITLTSHGPFDYLEPEDEELFPRATSLRQRYLNSMRYVDRALEAFHARLPEGTLLVIYGDHESGTLPPRTDDGGRRWEIVPFLVHHKGSRLRAADPELAESGTLEQLDLVTYLHRYARSFADPPREPAAVGARELP